MSAMHHSLPPLLMLLSVGYSSWQPVYFCLGSCRCAMAAPLPIQLIFCWHMPVLLQPRSVGDEICVIPRESDRWTSYPRVLYILLLLREIAKYPEMPMHVFNVPCKETGYLRNTIHHYHRILDEMQWDSLPKNTQGKPVESMSVWKLVSAMLHEFS